MSNPEWKRRYEKAIDFTRKAGRVAMRYFDTELAVDIKGDSSPVTIADRETEEVLRKDLSEAFPGDGFLGEEFGDTPGTTGYRWIIDPIDGTRSFVRGIPAWATLVGLEHKGELIAGFVDAPGFGHTYHALRGEGAWRNDRRIRVSDQADLSKSLVFYSGVNWFLKAGREQAFLELVRRTERQRGFGDWHGFLLVAQGSGEAMVEHGVHIWDIAAVVPIVEEAGGRFSNWKGGFDPNAPDALATNGKLHQDVISVLASDGKGG
jgi:histidinol-phosphatase